MCQNMNIYSPIETNTLHWLTTMKSTPCKNCKYFYPKGSTALRYDVYNFMLLGLNIQTLDGCPNGKPDYSNTSKRK